MAKSVYYERLASELSFVRDKQFKCDWNDMLSYCQITILNKNNEYKQTEEDNFLYEVLMKILQRGERPFTSYYVEKFIVEQYGSFFSLKEMPRGKSGTIKYEFDHNLKESYREFVDLFEPWDGDIEDLEFDQENPKNEKEFFSRILKRFDKKIPHCIATQVSIENVVDKKDATAFIGQRADFLLSFPNGKGLVLEPGNHDDQMQQNLDKRRDEAFRKIGFDTLRPRNEEIYEERIYNELLDHFTRNDLLKFLDMSYQQKSEKVLTENYLFLLPSLITQVERLLLHFWFKCGFAHKKEIKIGIFERDLECAEISLASFLEKLQRICSLYDITCPTPHIELYVQRNKKYKFKGEKNLDTSVIECDSFNGLSLDLILDVSIKCNNFTRPILSGAPHAGVVRQTYKHNMPIQYSYLSEIRNVNKENPKIDKLLNCFLQDFFRKYEMREGQKEIIVNILSQKSTIGLLPTSAGKSICYQLASIITPGITFVVDPIVALMNDQAQSLKEHYGIDRVFPWYAASKIQDKDVGLLLAGNIMVFISPERLQRPIFRSAMKSINARDIYVNYAVIDEAHCVSMWGHDFRPSYLMLERNFNNYFTFQGRKPVLVALTGTASQLVLIDLKRELNIQDLDAIVRPKSFDREELNFNIVKCMANQKKVTLSNVMAAIARRLNVQNLDDEACGIVFAYTPKELWELFGEKVANAKEYVRTVLDESSTSLIRYGFYSGRQSKKSGPGLNTEQWNRYKERTLESFKRGDIRLLYGNTAVGVGIDNEEINYIINYIMPQSFEAYYQQCGRAGRAKQHSECYLIFSDDDPVQTQRWLDRELDEMPSRWDDLGTVSYFHQINFPGEDKDIEEAYHIFSILFKKFKKELYEMSKIEVRMFYKQNMDLKEAERTERYISYWLILGVISDYDVTGSDANSTRYHIKLHPQVLDFLKDRNGKRLEVHIIKSLHEYLSRYRPIQLKDVEADINNLNDDTLSKRCIRYLIEFIYSQIEYQRRESIRTMVAYCNEDNATPEKLRSIIKAYFDSSEKFSGALNDMASLVPSFDEVAKILDKIEGFDDTEHLFWETRRLLDERFRADWAAANLFAVIYRSGGILSDRVTLQLDSIISSFVEVHKMEFADGLKFLAEYLSYFSRLDKDFGEAVSMNLQSEIVAYLYSFYGLPYVKVIEMMKIPDSELDLIKLRIANLQVKEIINEQYSRIIR